MLTIIGSLILARIDDIARGAGVYIPPTKHRRGPRQTHARAVLTKLAQRYGEGHLIFVLRSIVESENNARSLWSETILAVSDIVRMRPDLADRGGAFMEAFDRIPLDEVRDEARRLGVGPKRHVMRVMITRMLEAELVPNLQGRLL